jgi:hypothetical protein
MAEPGLGGQNLALEQYQEIILGLRVLLEEPSKTVQLLSESNPSLVMIYCLDYCQKDVEKWRKVLPTLDMIISLDTETGIPSNEALLNNCLIQLSENLNPAEFASLIPIHWKNVSIPYFKRCLAKYQAKRLKFKIVNLGQELNAMLQ